MYKAAAAGSKRFATTKWKDFATYSIPQDAASNTETQPLSSPQSSRKKHRKLLSQVASANAAVRRISCVGFAMHLGQQHQHCGTLLLSLLARKDKYLQGALWSEESRASARNLHVPKGTEHGTCCCAMGERHEPARECWILSTMIVSAERATAIYGSPSRTHLNITTLTRGQYANPVVHVGTTHDCSFACTCA